MPVRVVAVLQLVLLLAVVSSCRRGAGPILDATPGPEDRRGTISGTLEKPAGGGPVAGRLVRVVDVTSGTGFDARTNPAGGFTVQVPPGTYRLEIQLMTGEQVHDPPGEITVGPSEIQANHVITIGPPAPGT